MLRSILQNLISNAIKFTKAEGKISVSAKSNDDFIEIKVKDTGIGLAENDIQKLFKLDEHFSRKGTSDESGTGLGLLLVKDLIEKHGGKISVKSELDVGTSFIFTLPKA